MTSVVDVPEIMRICMARMFETFGTMDEILCSIYWGDGHQISERLGAPIIFKHISVFFTPVTEMEMLGSYYFYKE